MRIQHLTSHLNKQHAISISQIKILKKENALLKEKMDKLFAEISVIEKTSQMIENVPSQSIDAGDNEVIRERMRRTRETMRRTRERKVPIQAKWTNSNLSFQFLDF